MLKLSTLLSKLDFSTLGDLRGDLVGEAERLEGVEEVRDAINRECGKADGPSIYFGGNEIDCEIEWAIYFPEDEFWAGESETISYFPTTSCDEIIRFPTKAEAMRFRSNKHLVTSSIPFPVPKIKEAK